MVKKFLPLFIILLIFLGLGTWFFSRSPVLIVTDSYFEQLYGPGRLRLRGLWTSLELFRRVIAVEVSELAGPDLVALAAAGASSSPRAVFFPYRYLEGALLYIERHPDIPVLLMGQESPIPENSPPITFVRSDRAVDMYRAGLYAAILAADRQVFFISGDDLSDEDGLSFSAGLRSQGHFREPLFNEFRVDFPFHLNPGSIVAAGNIGSYLEQNVSVPVILFSWADPAYLPRTVKLLFDDSPWALAREALREFPPPHGEILVPSVPLLLLDRMEEKVNFFRHNKLLWEKI